ncbi:MAG: hypothetical protein IKE31_02440 [Eubacterium sp.]|nr:hypothetical protein [Eubacterium sp.]
MRRQRYNSSQKASWTAQIYKCRKGAFWRTLSFAVIFCVVSALAIPVYADEIDPAESGSIVTEDSMPESSADTPSAAPENTDSAPEEPAQNEDTDTPPAEEPSAPESEDDTEQETEPASAGEGAAAEQEPQDTAGEDENTVPEEPEAAPEEPEATPEEGEEEEAEPEEEETEPEEEEEDDDKEASFERIVLAGDGKNYRITVVCGADAEIPENADLQVEEITDSSAVYNTYVEETENALGLESGSAAYIRLFDIKIVDRDDPAVMYQPAEGSSVDVRIELADCESETLNVVHFADEQSDAEVVESTTENTAEGTAAEFQAEGFSVYAIVEAPEPVHFNPYGIDDVSGIAENQPYLLSYGSPQKYFTAVLTGSGCLTETTDQNAAAEWFFEKESGTDHVFYIYTLQSGEKKYIRQVSPGKVNVTLAASGTPFDLSVAETEKFFFKHNTENLWLQHSNGGGGIRLYKENGDVTNARIIITSTDTVPPENDPYQLNGKSYGIAWYDESATAASLTAEGITLGTEMRLSGAALVIRPDVLDREGVLLASGESDITEWTFACVQEDQYYITADVGGQTKYLTTDGAQVWLADAPDAEMSVFTACPGTGSNAGKWRFTVGDRSLNYTGSTANGFNAVADRKPGVWMNLVEKSTVLTDDDFTLYSARKVSVSDTDNVYDGRRELVLYTRIWNDTAKRYEFYAVDHDGSLIRCYDTGDGIEWVGTQVNTAAWVFTEYRNSDGTLNYYYELQNEQYGSYIAPRLSENSVMSDDTIGLQLNGRRYGESSTTIVTWDEERYSYSGMKAENGKVIPCALAEAEDFYFAVLEPVDPEEDPTEVDTIDSNAYGITMRMIDYNNEIRNKDGAVVPSGRTGRDSGQTAVLGYDTNTAGLLSSQIDEETGYPVTVPTNTGKDAQSLGVLYSGAVPVNHLFLKSIYNESGYFEYDSTSNFAHLNADNTFTVYDQLGAIADYSGVTGTHGQFMPYNDLKPGKYTGFANRTDVHGNELSDLNARKGEKLYNIGTRDTVDYFFGMDMEAGFTQTESGLDAWGHDIVFEFSGDDDFWFYVDGELVLDLGGVHTAMTGSINFRTGEVKSDRGNTTLYQVFKSNYEQRGMSAQEVAAKLEEKFEEKTVGGQPVYVFKDYSKHTMRMFYMERGAGASNLHMRFNLAAVKPGTVVLSKKLSGTESGQSSLIEFPYQIYYKTKDGTERYYRLTEKSGDTYNVTYKDSILAVPYKDHLTIDGRTYDDVFLLKPGESAEITLPKDTLDYYIVECAVNADVYDAVKANGETLAARSDTLPQDAAASGPDTAEGRGNYPTKVDTMANRPEVDYDNHVREGAMRTLSVTKKLYDTDGRTELGYDAEEERLKNETPFRFRLYLGNEFTPEDALSAADQYPYFIKDSNGHYCRRENGRFAALPYTDYASLKTWLDTLTDAEKETVIFVTSMNGSITELPAGYTVEVRNLIVGTRWKVEERDGEIPKGYTRRESDGYVRTDLNNQGYIYTDEGRVPLDPDNPVKAQPAADVILEDEDPAAEIRNQKGWGLTVKKVWTDRDFMDFHDDIYFAVYLNGTNDQDSTNDTLVNGTVRRLKSTESELYYFFDDLHCGTDSTYSFDQFVVREVTLTKGDDFAVDEETGEVTGYASVTPVYDGETLTIGGKPVGGEYRENGYTYTVAYDVGESTGKNENIRTDTVTNSRPGIKLNKAKWDGETPLAGAVFTLTDLEGNPVAAESYTSDDEGRITIAYLNKGSYILTETRTPKGYAALDQPMRITVEADGTVSVSGVEESCYILTQAKPATETEEAKMAEIIIKDRPMELHFIKTDAATGRSLPEAHFALYRQVTNASGEKVKDYQPVTGFEDLVTDSQGIPVFSDGGEALTIDTLTWGNTYYLTETQAPEEYEKLENDLCFTVGQNGTVTIESEEMAGWLTSATDDDGKRVYTVAIPNGEGGIALPRTGGMGVQGFLMAGGILTAAALFLLVIRFLSEKKKRT